MIRFLFLLVLLTPMQAQSLDTLQRLNRGAVVADLVSTEVALAQGHTELNPLVRKRAIRIPLILGSGELVNWIARKYDNKAVLWVSIAIHGAATGNNIVRVAW